MDSGRLVTGVAIFYLNIVTFVFSHGYSNYLADLTARNQLLTQEFVNSHPRGRYVMDFLNSEDYTNGHPVLDETRYGHQIDNAQWKEFVRELEAARLVAARESDDNGTEVEWPHPKWRNVVELPKAGIPQQGSSDNTTPARRTEVAQQNLLWGQHRVSGGSGEVGQWLDYALIGAGLQDEDEDDKQESRHGPGIPEFKENNLPAYCDPPNPCPMGHDPQQLDSPCDREFTYTAEANREWIMDKIAGRECTCDLEHMKSCSVIGSDQMLEGAENHLSEHQVMVHNPYIQGQKRKRLIVKKSHYYARHPGRRYYYHNGKVLYKVTKKAGEFGSLYPSM